jgi:hypothetical protein
MASISINICIQNILNIIDLYVKIASENEATRKPIVVNKTVEYETCP